MNEIKIIDLHTHTINSPDGNHEALFMAETARDNKIHTVAFTDHCEVDYFYKDNYDKVIENSYRDVSSVCEKLKGQINILKGVELAQPHYNTELAEKINVPRQTLYTIIERNPTKLKEELFNKILSGLEMTIIQLFGAALVIIPYTFITHSGEWLNFASEGGIYAILVGLLHTGVALFLYFSAIQELPAQTCALCSYIDPASALIFAAVLLGDVLSPLQWIGALMILGGAAVGEILGNKKSSAA